MAASIERELGLERIYISEIQLPEVADWALRAKEPVGDRMANVMEIGTLVKLSPKVCREAARLKSERRKAGFRKFGLIDGVILGAARSLGHRLITLDTDFEGEKGCVVLR